jgi:nuclear cap-binding protein subunit 1
LFLIHVYRTDDVDNPIVNPKKAFIIGVIDKEIRLSFAKRIRETLPLEYHKLILEGKFKDTPDFKYASERKVYHVVLYQRTWLTMHRDTILF